MASTRYPLDAWQYARLLAEVREKGTAYGAEVASWREDIEGDEAHLWVTRAPYEVWEWGASLQQGRHLVPGWEYTMDYVCSARELAALERPESDPE